MLTEAQAHHLFLHPTMTGNDRDTEGGSPVCVTQRLPSGMPEVATSHCDIPEVMGRRCNTWWRPGAASMGCWTACARCWPSPCSGTLWRAQVEVEYRCDWQTYRLHENYLALVYR